MGFARRLRLWCALLAGSGALAVAPAAHGAIPNVFDSEVDCAVQADDVRFCGGADTTIPAFDGVPIDVNVALPPEPASGPDGNFPVIGLFHGWGGSEFDLDDEPMRHLVDRGYAVFTMSDRGWGFSCGGQDPKRLDPTSGCEEGHNRLMDTRYEVRDAQDFLATLADEGVIDPARIGATGGSYGGGLSMALAALDDRQMMPDGSLVPWRSPVKDIALGIAAAAPSIPWSDLAYSLLPNGRTLDYLADSPYEGQIGVMKQSFVSGLYAIGRATSNYAPPGGSPDINGWFALINGGEPYDPNPLAAEIVEEVTTFHSSYYIDHSQPPAPLLISNGWTDDLFPPDEAIRFYNRTRSEHPGAEIALMFLDYGHQRGQNKEADTDRLRDKQDAWFDFYLKGAGTKPSNDVEVLTQVCGGPSAGPLTAASWRELTPGEIVHRDDDTQLISPGAANPAGATYDPIAAGDPCGTSDASDQPDVANYRLDPAPAGGFTLAGSPTIVADVFSPGPNNQLAYRLLDVGPSGRQTLVARGLYRPDDNTGAATRQVFQAHPNAYEFEAGHVAKLELRPHDAPYSRPSNGQGPITVANLELRLPVLEAPNGGLIKPPAPKVVPAGSELAAGYPAGEVDSDGDGVVDGDDDCPGDPGPAGNDGCPDGPPSDADGDGVADDSDACPDEPGSAENVGCPDEGGNGGGNGGGQPDFCGNEIEGTAGPDRLRGSRRSDLIRGLGAGDSIRAGRGPDCLRGGNGKDRIRGGKGADEARGQRGADRLRGNKGKDRLRGGPGRDDLNGNKGKDSLRGGRGNDRFEARGNGRDTVRCGGGFDVAEVGRRDRVSRNCERVRRG